jgi:hypothetical protein
VTEQSTQAEPGPGSAAAKTSPPTSASDAALARYRVSMRRGRAIYYAVVGVIVVAAAVVVGVVWSRGEVAHTSLRTVSPVPPTVAIQSPSQNLTVAWKTGDHIALGAPQYGGTIVTFSQHTVGGRDARTGKRTWAYTRTDRNVCTAAQLNSTTIAIYENDGNCDEVSAFDSDSGRRRWTRTLDMDGLPVDGQPTYQVTPYTMMITTPSVVYTIDPVTGYTRWTYQRYGCRIEHAVIGATGALISQNCSRLVRCKGVKFCGTGPQLFLRDGTAARGDDAKPNADNIKWNRLGDASIPVSVDQVVSAVSANEHTLYLYDSTTGGRHRLALQPPPDSSGPVTAVATTSSEIITVSGETYSVPPDATSVDWAVDTLSPPTVASTTDEATPTLATARITVPTNSGVLLLDGNTGQPTEQFNAPTPAAGSTVYSLGTGFLVTGATGIVAYK